jgi:2-succinyl-6-hydroxy-2,4-cyclohexadiene-1-carboxylate synthase
LEKISGALAKKMTLHCLPGFLGLSKDWETILSKRFSAVYYDFFAPHSENCSGPSDSPDLASLDRLGAWVNGQAKSNPAPRILMGYSFGGRVALHSLIQAPKLWTAAVIVSAHPGLSASPLASGAVSEEHSLRIQSDQVWARRFLNDDWPTVLEDWNSQAVLKTSRAQTFRDLHSLSRTSLAQALTECSLGKQGDLRRQLQHLELPILWISGKQDAKFCSLLNEVTALNPNIEGVTLPQAGHRVPWDQPEEFNQVLSDFIDRCEKQGVKNGKLD